MICKYFCDIFQIWIILPLEVKHTLKVPRMWAIFQLAITQRVFRSTWTDLHQLKSLNQLRFPAPLILKKIIQRPLEAPKVLKMLTRTGARTYWTNGSPWIEENSIEILAKLGESSDAIPNFSAAKHFGSYKCTLTGDHYIRGTLSVNVDTHCWVWVHYKWSRFEYMCDYCVQ